MYVYPYKTIPYSEIIFINLFIFFSILFDKLQGIMIWLSGQILMLCIRNFTDLCKTLIGSQGRQKNIVIGIFHR